MIVTVFRKEHFNAAHRLNNPEWSIDKNREIFGLCNNNNFHGHNYTLVVKLKGETDPETGYLMDLKILKDLIHEEVIEPFDHSNLNLDLAEFKNLNPTAENIAFVIWNKLRKRIDPAIMIGVILYETERNYVEYEGE